MTDLRLLRLNCDKVRFEPFIKLAEICGLCCLEEGPELLLKADSVTDVKKIFQGSYKDTRLTLIETVLLSFLSRTLNMVSFAESLSEVCRKIWNFTKGFIKFLTLQVKSRYSKSSSPDIIKTWKCWLLCLLR